MTLKIDEDQVWLRPQKENSWRGEMKQTGNTFGGLLVCLKILAFSAGAKNGSSDIIKDSESP